MHKMYQEIGYFYLHIWIDMDKMYQVSRNWILLPAHTDTYGYIWIKCIKKLDTFTCTYGYIWIDMDKMYPEVGYCYLHIWIDMDKVYQEVGFFFTCTTEYIWIHMDTFGYI